MELDLLTRNEFAEYWNRVRPGLGDPDSSLWAYERHTGKSLEWFVSVNPIRISIRSQDDYHDWCRKYCPSGISCYSASMDIEWYGFGNKDEMLLWLLRWA